MSWLAYIIVNADVAHCFVFTNKAVLLLSRILTAAFMDSDQGECRGKNLEMRLFKVWKYFLKKGEEAMEKSPHSVSE